MKRSSLIVFLALCLVVALIADSYAEWDITFESKTVSQNATGVNVNVFGSWDLPLAGITCPIVVRQIDEGSFWTGELPYDTGGNGYYHPHQFNVQWKWIDPPFSTLIEEFRPGVPSGICEANGDVGYDGSAPDHFVINATGFGAAESARENFNFLSFQFDVTDDAGSFEFDTACFASSLYNIFMIDDAIPPINHGPGGTGEASFLKGVITISEELELGWWPQCACPDPDGITEDVITDPYGARYYTNRQPPYDYHEGIDIDFEVDEPIHAVARGDVQGIFYLGSDYGYQLNINSTVLDHEGIQKEVRFQYIHINDPTSMTIGQDVQKASQIATCGHFYAVGTHLHLMAKPDYEYDERAHPVRFLSKPENTCPVFNAGLGDPVVDNDYLQCTSLSQKSEKYDLAAIHIFVYASDTSRDTTIDFENYNQMKANDINPEYRFFKDTDFDVTVTLTPLQSLLTGDSIFSRIDIKVDPVESVPSCDYIGIYLQDVSKRNCAGTGLCNTDPLGRVADDYYCPGLCNFSGENPGMLLEFFEGRRLANHSVELYWRGISGVQANGVMIYRVETDGTEELIHRGGLPFRQEEGDTVYYYDYATRADEELQYRMRVLFPNGAKVFAAQNVVIEAEISESDAIPYTFMLEQNYPNPFNAGTMINYAIDSKNTGTVTIDVFDILGRHVTMLYSNETPEPGRYTVRWDGSDANGRLVASGVYFYRLTAAEGHIVKRMVLIR